MTKEEKIDELISKTYPHWDFCLGRVVRATLKTGELPDEYDFRKAMEGFRIHFVWDEGPAWCGIIGQVMYFLGRKFIDLINQNITLKYGIEEEIKDFVFDLEKGNVGVLEYELSKRFTHSASVWATRTAEVLNDDKVLEF